MSILVLGGAGFIGGHVATRYLARGEQVTVLDNFSRRGTRENVAWLKENYPAVELVEADIARDQDVLRSAAAKATKVFHMAGQVAVTTSVKDPRADFEANALGTFNILEALRLENPDVPIIYASTNKVYGKMENVAVVAQGERYAYADKPEGIGEDQPLEFYSPYGCSKGAGDQYVRDYARIYNMKTVVFRQSCIYGTRQFGIEDQGWLAWFTIAALFGKQISIYGDGKQVRDVLYIDDLVDAYEAALAAIDTIAGQAYNVGGGPQSTVSLRELIALLQEFFGQPVNCTYGDWRPGDQKIFVCDTAKAKRDFGWQPKVTVTEGVQTLAAWAKENQATIASLGLI